MPETSAQKEALSTEFFVTEECNGCGLCKNVAPEFFDYVDYAYYYYISRQPVNETEAALIREAADICTVDAIRETSKVH